MADVLLDFGGVLYGLDFARWEGALASMVGPNGTAASEHVAVLNEALEVDALSPEGFRARLRAMLDTRVDDVALDAAWNALLVGPLPGVDAAIAHLAGRHRLFLVSNTNPIHFDFFAGQCPFLARFTAQCLSFRMGVRKPSHAYFERVLAENGLDRDACVFVDDTVENVEAATRCGLRALEWPRNASPDGLASMIAKVVGA